MATRFYAGEAELVHLAVIGFDEKFRHGTGENNTRVGEVRHV